MRTSRCSSWIRKRQRNQRSNANIRWIIEKARELQKDIYFCFTEYAKAFDCVDHSKLWEILKEMGILDHLTCLLRNLHAGQEVTELDIKQYWFKIGERVHQGCILSTYLFNLHAEYIMRNAGLNDSQAEIKIACLLSHVHLFATP